MKNKSYKLQIEEYNSKYGSIPIEQNEILSYLEKELKLKDKDFKMIEEEDSYVESIPWERLKIILPIVPNPSPRPRYSSVSGCFYVTGAAENKKLLKYYIDKKYNIVYTRTYFSLKVFLPTPTSSMNRREIYRAEKGTILPISNPDWDNVGKTYSDMIQKILILNDNIINKGLVEKYYSIKPRVEIDIQYQKGFDSKFNKRKIVNSTAYQEYVEFGKVIEYHNEGNDIW